MFSFWTQNRSHPSSSIFFPWRILLNIIETSIEFLEYFKSISPLNSMMFPDQVEVYTPKISSKLAYPLQTYRLAFLIYKNIEKTDEYLYPVGPSYF